MMQDSLFVEEQTTNLGAMLRATKKTTKAGLGDVTDAVDPFFDHGLAVRNRAEKERWEAEARQAIENAIGPERIAEMQENLKASLELLQTEAKAIEAEIEGTTIRVPDYDAPLAELPAIRPEPLVSSDMPLQEAISILRERKDYTVN